MYNKPKPDMSNMVFGLRPVEETLVSGKEIEKIYFAKSQPNLQELIKAVKAKNIPFSFVPEEKLNFYTKKNHQGVVCFVSPVFYNKIENIVQQVFEEGRTPFILVLDRITDVRNLGGIARSAECAGVDAIVIPSRGAAQVTPDAIRSSSGALQHIPVCREENLKDTIKYLKDSGLDIIACTEKATKNMYEVNLKNPLALIMGSEEDGISDEYLKICTEKMKIPMIGKLASLNVSIASGVALFEVVRQRF